MKLFGLAASDQDQREGASTGRAPESTLRPDTGTSQGLFGRRTGVMPVPVDVNLDNGELKRQYEERLDEIFSLIKSRKGDSEGKIKVDTVTVKLGVDVGGTIGWFVEGRIDISLAFEVQFKVSE